MIIIVIVFSLEFLHSLFVRLQCRCASLRIDDARNGLLLRDSAKKRRLSRSRTRFDDDALAFSAGGFDELFRETLDAARFGVTLDGNVDLLWIESTSNGFFVDEAVLIRDESAELMEERVSLSDCWSVSSLLRCNVSREISFDFLQRPSVIVGDFVVDEGDEFGDGLIETLAEEVKRVGLVVGGEEVFEFREGGICFVVEENRQFEAANEDKLCFAKSSRYFEGGRIVGGRNGLCIIFVVNIIFRFRQFSRNGDLLIISQKRREIVHS